MATKVKTPRIAFSRTGADPVVYCGYSNLALLGEEQNGNNLITIHDKNIATAFALEALPLVDHCTGMFFIVSETNMHFCCNLIYHIDM